MPFLTVFSAPKPFTDAHIARIQRNAIRSWLNLAGQDEVQVILTGAEEGLAEAAASLGAGHIPEVERNSQGTPLVSSIFSLVRQAADSPFLLYINADVLLLPAVLAQIEKTARQFQRFLLVGQRWDLDLGGEWDFSPGWDARLEQEVLLRGRLHPPSGSDYFIFPAACFEHIPGFAIGRSGWDNWMIYEGRRQMWPVIDATAAIVAVHQDHDYAHLPGGEPHHHLPETYENVRLAGGKRSIFHLRDASWRLPVEGQAARQPFSWPRFWRELEIFPLISLHSRLLANLVFAVFHPQKAYAELRPWLGARARRLLGRDRQPRPAG